MPKFTLRRNGKRMAEIKLEYTIDEQQVKRVAEHLNCTLAKAVKLIRKELQSEISSHLAWQVLTCDTTNALQFIHVDNVEQAKEDGYISFDIE